MKEAVELRSFPALDALRGIATIVVVQFHIRGLFAGYSVDSTNSLGDGYLAVDLFFALSGFVLAHIYIPRFRGGMSAIDFMRVRIIRFYPLYFLGLVVGSVFLAINLRRLGSLSIEDIARAFALEAFFLPAKIENSNQLFPINNVSWSLFVELITNLIFVMCWKKINRMALVGALVVFGLVLFLYIFSNQAASLGNTWETMVGGVFRALFSFFYGVFINHLYREGVLRFNTTVMVFVASVIAFSALLLMPVGAIARPYFDIIFITAIVPVLIAIGINVHLYGKLAKFASFLGSSSYAIYCLHYPTLAAIVFLSKRYFDGDPPVLLITAASVALFLIASFFIDLFYDIPVRRFLMARNNSRKMPALLAGESMPSD